MNFDKTIFFKLILGLLPLGAPTQGPRRPAFDVVPLGVRGGLDEGNLSAYLVAPTGSTAYVCLDAGTLRTGLDKAVADKVFAVDADAVLKTYIKAYLLSHAHLDHVAGLLLNAPADDPKTIYGLPSCLATLQNDYFNWRAWPNFGPAGAPPALGKYRLQALEPGPKVALPETALRVRTFPLSHARPYESAAFLLRSHDDYLLYLGDTGADELEQSHHLQALWQAVGPLMRAGQLKAIFIETSYANEQSEKLLFGHLTPARLMQELAALGQVAGPGARHLARRHHPPQAAGRQRGRHCPAAGSGQRAGAEFGISGAKPAVAILSR